MAGPFLKWAGGKAKLAQRIIGMAPPHFGAYHEPFLGAGAVFFALCAEGRIQQAHLSDYNEELINCYSCVRDQSDCLGHRLSTLAGHYHSKAGSERANFYYSVRADEPVHAVDRAARLIFLNKTCYNGLFRVNSRGGFNVPHGRYEHPPIHNPSKLRDASVCLQSAELVHQDFERACQRAQPGDLVYLDPPYHPLSKTARFTAYTTGEFGPGDQARLRVAFDDLTKRGVAAMLSNSAHQFIAELYADYSSVEVPMSRSINSVVSGRKAIPELLVTNFSRKTVKAALTEMAKPRP